MGCSANHPIPGTISHPNTPKSSRSVSLSERPVLSDLDVPPSPYDPKWLDLDDLILSHERSLQLLKEQCSKSEDEAEVDYVVSADVLSFQGALPPSQTSPNTSPKASSRSSLPLSPAKTEAESAPVVDMASFSMFDDGDDNDLLFGLPPDDDDDPIMLLESPQHGRVSTLLPFTETPSTDPTLASSVPVSEEMELMNYLLSKLSTARDLSVTLTTLPESSSSSELSDKRTTLLEEKESLWHEVVSVCDQLLRLDYRRPRSFWFQSLAQAELGLRRQASMTLQQAIEAIEGEGEDELKMITFEQNRLRSEWSRRLAGLLMEDNGDDGDLDDEEVRERIRRERVERGVRHLRESVRYWAGNEESWRLLAEHECDSTSTLNRSEDLSVLLSAFFRSGYSSSSLHSKLRQCLSNTNSNSNLSSSDLEELELILDATTPPLSKKKKKKRQKLKQNDISYNLSFTFTSASVPIHYPSSSSSLFVIQSLSFPENCLTLVPSTSEVRLYPRVSNSANQLWLIESQEKSESSEEEGCWIIRSALDQSQLATCGGGGEEEGQVKLCIRTVDLERNDDDEADGEVDEKNGVTFWTYSRGLLTRVDSGLVVDVASDEKTLILSQEGEWRLGQRFRFWPVRLLSGTIGAKEEELGHLCRIRDILKNASSEPSSSSAPDVRFCSLVDFARRNLWDLIAAALERSSEPNGYYPGINEATPTFENTALHLAVISDRNDVCELLLRHGADPNIKNADGQCPASIAHRLGRELVGLMLRQVGALVSVGRSAWL